MAAVAIVGSNVKLEVQSTLGAPVTVQSITQDSSGITVVGANSNGFSNGDIVILDMTSGMDQLDGQAGRVANASTNAFDLEGIDITGFETFVSGTVVKVASFATFAKAQTVSAPNPPPTKIDVTTLIDVVKKNVFGLPEAPDGTIGALFNPGGATEAIIRTATTTNTPRAFRITYADSRKTVFNALVSGGFGFELAPNDAAKSSVSFTLVGLMVHYAT